MRKIRGYNEVDGGSSDLLDQVVAQRARLSERLSSVRHVVAVASGKGGVGKSVVTANLAAVLASRGRSVGALDADLNGPTLARMLGAERAGLVVTGDGVRPAPAAAGVGVVSMDLLLSADDAPVRWQEPAEGAFIWQSTLETGALREFLADVEWGTLDYLLIDLPPGTDKLGRLLELLPGLGAALLVTTPSDAARFVVAKSVRLVQDAGVPVVGLAANMSTYTCPDCGRADPLFAADGARRLSDETGVPIWAEVPFDPRLAAQTDAGAPFALDHAGSPAGAGLHALADRLEEEVSA